MFTKHFYPPTIAHNVGNGRPCASAYKKPEGVGALFVPQFVACVFVPRKLSKARSNLCVLISLDVVETFLMIRFWFLQPTN